MQVTEAPEIDEKDFAALPPRARVALLARRLWRLMPLTGGDLLPEERRMIVALVAVVAAFSRGEAFERQWQAVLVTAVERARSNSHLPASSAVLSLSYAVLMDVDDPALSGTPRLFDQAGESLDFKQPAQSDFAWLSAWALDTSSAEVSVPLEFFQRPLWGELKGELLPKSVEVAFEKWAEALDEADLDWMASFYLDMVKGITDVGEWDQLWVFVADWFAEPLQTTADESGETPTPPTPLLSGIVNAAADRPADEDHLGRAPLIETLADMLSYPGQALPMTIALLGDWGSGKSTVIHQLKARLRSIREQEETLDLEGSVDRRKRRARFLFAEFNAWEYEQTDSMRAGLAQEVVKGLTDGLGRWRKFLLAFERARRSHTLEFWQTAGTLVLAVIGVWVGIDLASPDEVRKALESSRLAREIGGTGMVGVSGYLLFNVWRSGRRLLEHPLASQLNTYLKLPSYGKHLGDVPVIKHDLETLCRMRLQQVPNGRLLVIVDDLDRCRPAAITETFDAIRLVMNMADVAVIVAIDDRIAFRAVADHYRKLAEGTHRTSEEVARDYLSKIIQLPVNLYQPWHWEVSEFVHKALFATAEDKEPKNGDAVHRPERGAAAGKEETALPAETAAEDQQSAGVQPHEVAQTERDGTDKAPSTAAVERQAERVYELMRDLDFERDLFAALARELHFHNPRQLIRLKNSYSLLKGYRHQRALRKVPDRRLGERLMHGLFWYEYLYQCNLDHRRRDELVVWLWPEESAWRNQLKTPHVEGALPPAVAMARRFENLHGLNDYHRDYAEIMATVEMAILPNAQMGLIEDLAQARLVRAEIERNEGGFKPWPAWWSETGAAR